MTLHEYYELLRIKKEQTNWENYEEVKAYNRYAQELRKQLNKES